MYFVSRKSGDALQTETEIIELHDGGNVVQYARLSLQTQLRARRRKHGAHG
jgi:hypothetical protein